MKLRHLLPLAMIWAMMTSCNSTEKYPDYLGNIEHIKVTCSTAKDVFGEITPQDIELVFIADFNENSLPEVKKYYDEDGDLMSTEKNTYDDHKNLIKQTRYSSDGEIESKYIAEYENDKLVMQEQEYQSYDDQMKRNKWEYEYEKGELSSVIFHLDGELMSKQIYEDKGDHKEIKVYEADGELSNRIYYKTNKNNQLLMFYNPDFSESDTLKVEYNDRNLPIKTENYGMMEEALIETTVYMYTDNESFKYEYEYDKVGNWIKRTVYEIESGMEKPIYVVTREITYR